ncbi:1-acyl-sn-glycerol-3-phosphate acyltransferase [Asticcacaulis sp. AC402]|uniref:lysophospholipid acyltransferase family protein n=1 Tax=Asticcacaulis sp. AC402 TaxID=1282361 RepID=UPI0003C3B777|nr:lysophospholipid acyltransferase family protein [Asticcacaulis sp. AC402]ESQ77160.1 1-acyl-sn-glycerol-3-phosphate acyltransferase [Asticcacaulis sp. AC402]
MTRLRSLLFILWLYGSMAFYGIVCSPFMLLPLRYAMLPVRWWGHTVLFGARWIVGIRVEFRGLEHMPDGPALLAGKHLSMLDTIAPFTVLKLPAFVLKQELLYMPFLGWFAARTKMVPVRRDEAAKALKSMVSACRERLTEGRQILIFPEGTRSELGKDPIYKPGVAALYRDLEVPCHLMATNSGQFWPGHGIDRKPGTVVFEFLPPLPAGLKRAEFMAQVKDRLETASNILIAEQTAPR